MGFIEILLILSLTISHTFLVYHTPTARRLTLTYTATTGTNWTQNAFDNSPDDVSFTVLDHTRSNLTTKHQLNIHVLVRLVLDNRHVFVLTLT